MMLWSERRALAAKHAADEPSCVWSRRLLLERPRALRADHL